MPMTSLLAQATACAIALPFVFVVWQLSTQYLTGYFTRKYTVLYELENLGKARLNEERTKGTAVICGGAIAGLWAARAASDHFENVIIIEPEAWAGSELGKSNPFSAKGTRIQANNTPPRTRISQYTNALHLYQPVAYRALKKCFPDFDEEVKNANGSVREDHETNLHTFGRKVWRISNNNHIKRETSQCFWLSRDSYERLLRRLVLKSSNRVRWITGTVTGFDANPKDLSILSSVTLRLPDGTEQKVPSTLVIDCSGGAQAGLKFIRRIASASVNAEILQKLRPPSALDWDKLKVDYDIGLRSTCFRFHVPPEACESLPIPGGYENNIWPYSFAPIPGKESKYYLINRIEGHRINFYFSGWGDVELPHSLDEVVDWFKRLEVDHAKVPDWIYSLFDRLLEYRDQCEFFPAKYPEQFWIYWESAPYVPSNFIAIGDAVMRINPMTGQGCSKAAMGAITFDAILRQQSSMGLTSIPAGFGRDFFRVHRDKIKGLWDGIKSVDYMFPTTKPIRGERLSDEWMKGNLSNLISELAGLDDEVDAELAKIRSLVAPPQILFKPRLLLKTGVYIYDFSMRATKLPWTVRYPLEPYPGLYQRVGILHDKPTGNADGSAMGFYDPHYAVDITFVSDPNNSPVDFKCREFLANNCGYMDEAKGNGRCFDSYNGKLLMGSMLKGSNRMCLASDTVLASLFARLGRASMSSLSTLAPVTAGAVLLPLALLAWKLTGRFLNDYFTRKSTILYELEHIGNARLDDKRIKGTAVICGGGMAGLWTARAAADHFEDVLVIEPEAWVGSELGKTNPYNTEGERIQETTPPRTRVMQYSNSVHVFQPIAYWALKKYFPNFDEEVKNANGRIQDYEVNAYSSGRQILRMPKDGDYKAEIPQCFWLSRDSYERILRRLVLASSDRVRWMTGTVSGLHIDPQNPSILSAVSVRSPDGSEKIVPATLVVDCSGGTQAGLKFIRRIASEPSNAEKLQKLVHPRALPWDQLRVTYDCRQPFICFRFYVPPEGRDSLPIPGGYENNVWPYTYVPMPGKERKLYIINRIEGHHINLAFSGWGDPDLPRSVVEIVDWLKAFEIDHSKVPDWVYALTEELLKCRYKCQVLPARFPEQSWIHWESAPFIPSNFIAIGDSVMRVNPTFGQGCSKAAMGAMTLDGMLRKQPITDLTSIPPGFGREFFKVHSDKIEGIWDGTKPMDYMSPTTRPVQGEKLSDEWLKGNLAKLVMELAGLDDKVDAELFKVRFFLAPPQALFKPHLLLKYAAFALRKQLNLVPSAC